MNMFELFKGATNRNKLKCSVSRTSKMIEGTI
jgi:hypothetical protein